jgi:uncharacterized protein (DUF1778 family)
MSNPAATASLEYIELSDAEADLISRAAALDGEDAETWLQRHLVEAARDRVSGRRK